MKRLSAGLIVVLLLAGCASSPGASPPPSGPAPERPTDTSQAIELVNLWRVSDAEGESSDTWLRLDADGFDLWRPCGPISGSWTGSESLILASVHGASGECVTEGAIPEVPWLESVTRYAPDADGWQLQNARGETVATLTIDGGPEPIPTVAEFLTQPPEVTDATREKFRVAAALPAGMEPVTSDALLGRWLPIGEGAGTEAHLEFEAPAQWSGSDGCNGGEGRWAVGEDGELLATSGPSTLIACPGAPLPAFLAQSSRAGFHEDALVLFDADGTELTRLMRGAR